MQGSFSTILHPHGLPMIPISNLCRKVYAKCRLTSGLLATRTGRAPLFALQQFDFKEWGHEALNEREPEE